MSNIPRIICIYKITSPSGRIYIGQTINFFRRLSDYKNKLAYKQPALNNSILKYGLQNHSIEIIHELPCDVTQEILNEYECLYMELYRNCGIKLLNTKAGGSNGRNSDESIKKANDKWKIWYRNNPDGNKKSIENSVKARKGKGLSKEHREKLRARMTGRVFSDIHKANHVKSLKGKKKTITESFLAAQRAKAAIIGGANKKGVNQFTLNGDLINNWPSIMHAERETGIAKSSITRCLKRGGKSAGGYLWKYSAEGNMIDFNKYKTNHSPIPKKVVQLSMKGLIIREWPSQTAASKELAIPVTNISRCAKRKAKSAGGYIWQYR